MQDVFSSLPGIEVPVSQVSGALARLWTARPATPPATTAPVAR